MMSQQDDGAVTFVPLVREVNPIVLSPQEAKGLRSILSRPPKTLDVGKDEMLPVPYGAFHVDAKQFQWYGRSIGMDSIKQGHKVRIVWEDAAIDRMFAVVLQAEVLYSRETFERCLEELRSVAVVGSNSAATRSTTRESQP